MKVLIDTCIWSLALRHKMPDMNTARRLGEIIQDGRAVIIGPIRQEILSGIFHENQFETLKKNLEPFEDIALKSRHFITAAEYSNICMKKGTQGSNTDFLICAVAHLENLQIFTNDLDFTHYKKHIPIQLF